MKWRKFKTVSGIRMVMIILKHTFDNEHEYEHDDDRPLDESSHHDHEGHKKEAQHILL
jgi:hypothetical protein